MKSILIVEDDITYSMILKAWLAKKGFQVQSASSIARAQKVVESDNIDLILSDLRLPDRDGIDLLKWMREHGHMTPLIIMTGYADIQSAVQAIKLGAQDYVAKPVNPDELLKKMEEAEKSLEDTDFPGAEERIFQKLMERKAAEEEKEERAGKPAQMPEPAPSGASISGGAAPKRFRKRKLAISAVLAAAFAVLLGITAIGGRSYFLRERKNELNVTIINNNQNKKRISQIEEAYQLIETELKIPVLRLDYVPPGLEFKTAIWKETSSTGYGWKNFTIPGTD